MCDPLGIGQIGRAVVDDQVIGIDRLDHRPVAKRAIIPLFERRAAKAQHQQHPVSVRVIFGRNRRQEVVQVRFQRIGQLVFLRILVVVVVADLNRPVSRQQLGTRIGLKAQDSFKQQRMANLTHTINRRTVRSTRQRWHFNLEAQQFYALRPIFNPFFAAFKVIFNVFDQFGRNLV